MTYGADAQSSQEHLQHRPMNTIRPKRWESLPSINPIFQIRLEFNVARTSTISTRQTLYFLGEMLKEPIFTTCSLKGCKWKHRYQLELDLRGRRNDAWGLSQTSNVCTGKEVDLTPEDVSLQTILIHSPIFTYHKPKAVRAAQHHHAGYYKHHVPWVSPEMQINHVLQKLRAINEQPRKEHVFAIYANSECGLRVKVGNANDHCDFTMRTIKSLLKFGLQFEGQFDRIHSSDRIRLGDLHTSAWVQQVNRVDTWTKMFKLVDTLPITETSIDVSGLPRTGMIEFRQHAMTSDFEEVMAWVQLVVAVTVFCDLLSCSQSRRYMGNRFGDLDMSILHILEDISWDGRVDISIAKEHYTKLLLGVNGWDYAEVRYEDAIRQIEKHPLRDLLQHVEVQKLLNSNRNAVSITIMQKILSGQYGWLPEGSPLQEEYSWLPVLSPKGRACSGDKEETEAVKDIEAGPKSGLRVDDTESTSPVLSTTATLIGFDEHVFAGDIFEHHDKSRLQPVRPREE